MSLSAAWTGAPAPNNYDHESNPFSFTSAQISVLGPAAPDSLTATVAQLHTFQTCPSSTKANNTAQMSTNVTGSSSMKVQPSSVNICSPASARLGDVQQRASSLRQSNFIIGREEISEQKRDSSVLLYKSLSIAAQFRSGPKNSFVSYGSSVFKFVHAVHGWRTRGGVGNGDHLKQSESIRWTRQHITYFYKRANPTLGILLLLQNYYNNSIEWKQEEAVLAPHDDMVWGGGDT
ncbi:hypothetical protein R3P38DRAFT_2799494 [Favolaschia claudopus]|uniref:Uncharacterized protein n=1 Tax=Favolaschia claudopus TaxID=2862362 RepID=A0AAV9ZZJ2_9AGAR